MTKAMKFVPDIQSVSKIMALEKPNFWVSNGIKCKINPTHG